MESCPGSLSDLVLYSQSHSPLPLLLKIDILIHVASGLAYLHHNSLFHGNLHPDNILVSSNLKPRLTDIQMVGVEQQYLHREFKTPFSAPEERDPSSSHAAAGDVFAMGRILLWLLRDGRSLDDDLADISMEAVKLMIRGYTAEEPKVVAENGCES